MRWKLPFCSESHTLASILFILFILSIHGERFPRNIRALNP